MKEKELRTWRKEKDISFSYIGSIRQGTMITYGTGRQFIMCKHEYKALLDHFQGQTVNIGTSRDNPPPGSVGEWLQLNVTKTAIASYVGPILIHEGYAEHAGGAELRFLFGGQDE